MKVSLVLAWRWARERWRLPKNYKLAQQMYWTQVEKTREAERQRDGVGARLLLAKAKIGDLEQQAREQLAAAAAEVEELPGLSAAEVERLAILVEECGEVAQAAGKVLRHGYDSQSPYGGKPNRQALEREIGNVRAVVMLMLNAGDIDLAELQAWQRRKRDQIGKWTHHQECSMPREAQLEMMRSIEIERLESER